MPNFFLKFVKKQLKVVSESLPLSIVIQIYGEYFISPNKFYIIWAFGLTHSDVDRIVLGGNIVFNF